jgi:hypothetical protein
MSFASVVEERVARRSLSYHQCSVHHSTWVFFYVELRRREEWSIRGCGRGENRRGGCSITRDVESEVFELWLADQCLNAGEDLVADDLFGRRDIDLQSDEEAVVVPKLGGRLLEKRNRFLAHLLADDRECVWQVLIRLAQVDVG